MAHLKGLRGKVLGLAIGDRSILVAEVSASGGDPEVKHAAEFPLPEGVSLDQPDVLGKALGQFLKQQRMHVGQAVVGLPAKWVLVKAKEVPPADPEAAAGLLRLQAEREFSPELKDLVYDFAGQPSASETRSVLLMATPRKYLTHIETMAEAARITVKAVTPWAAALGEASGRLMETDAPVLYLGAGSAELTARCSGGLCVLRHLRPTPVAAIPVAATVAVGRESVTEAAPSDRTGGTNGSSNGSNGSHAAGAALLGFSNELRRVFSMLPADKPSGKGITNGENGSGHRGPRELVLWDGVGVEPSAYVALSERLGVTVKPGRELAKRSMDAGTSGGSQAGPGRFAPAVALGVAGLQEGLLPVDFLHSRLREAKKRVLGRQAIWGIAVTAAVAVASFIFYNDVQKKAAYRDELTEQLKQQKPTADAARAAVDRALFARSWYGTQPKYLDCLRDLTNAVPEQSGTWMTGLTIREASKSQTGVRPGTAAAPEKGTLQVNVTGKSTNDDIPRRILAALRGTKRMTDVSFTDVRQNQSTKGPKEVAFTITFNYQLE